MFSSAESVRSTSQWGSSEAGSEESGIQLQAVASSGSAALLQNSWRPDQEVAQSADAFGQRDMNLQFDQLMDLSFLEYLGEDVPEDLSPRWAGPSGHLIFSPNPFLRTPKAFSASSFENNSSSTANDHLWKELDDAKWTNRIDGIIHHERVVSIPIVSC